MKKLYDNKPVAFALIWIVLYVVVFGTIRGSYGDDSLWGMLGLTAVSAALLVFVKRYRLEAELGLNAWPSDWKRYLYFIPMWILSTANLWGGIHKNYSGMPLVYAVVSMILVGFVEEMVFRGFLFRGMLKDGSAMTAIVVSAVTFGVGHIVNLFTGQATLETCGQILFAVAWGFMMTMAYYKSGSLLPSILTHSLIDVFTNFGTDTFLTTWGQIIITIIVSLAYCLYLSKLETKINR